MGKTARSLSKGEERLSIMSMAGSEDRLIGVQLMKEIARDCREGMTEDKSLVWSSGSIGGASAPVEGLEIREGGVSKVVVEGAGHDNQNDVKAERVAADLRNFVEAL